MQIHEITSNNQNEFSDCIIRIYNHLFKSSLSWNELPRPQRNNLNFYVYISTICKALKCTLGKLGALEDEFINPLFIAIWPCINYKSKDKDRQSFLFLYFLTISEFTSLERKIFLKQIYLK